MRSQTQLEDNETQWEQDVSPQLSFLQHSPNMLQQEIPHWKTGEQTDIPQFPG